MIPIPLIPAVTFPPSVTLPFRVSGAEICTKPVPFAVMVPVALFEKVPPDE